LLTALVVALGFSLHPALFYYAQEARCYSLLTFLVISNCLALQCFIVNPTHSRGVLVGVLNFLVFYTHYIAGFLLLFQFIYLLSVLKRRQLYFILHVFLIPTILVLLRFTKKQYQVLFFSAQSSAEKGNIELASFSRLRGVLGYLTPLEVEFYVLLVLCIFPLIYALVKKKDLQINDSSFSVYMFGSGVGSLLTLFLIGHFMNVFDARYLLFTIPLFFMSAPGLIANKMLINMLFVILIVSSLTRIKFGASKKMDYRSAANLAKEIKGRFKAQINIQPHDLVDAFLYYYDRRIFEMKKSKDPELLATHEIFFGDTYAQIRKLKIDTTSPLMIFQSYERKADQADLDLYLKSIYEMQFVTNGLEGVRISFFWRNRNSLMK
jgi:hypothetical protein